MNYAIPSQATQFVEMIRALPKGKRVVIRCEKFQGNMLYFEETYDEKLYQFPDRSVVKIRNEVYPGEKEGEYEDYNDYGVAVVGYSDKGDLIKYNELPGIYTHPEG